MTGLLNVSISVMHLTSGDDFLSAAKSAGYNEKYLVDTGLCGKSERGTLYDRFKARVIYPVLLSPGRLWLSGGARSVLLRRLRNISTLRNR